MFISDNAQGSRVQEEIPPCRGLQAEPACGEHVEKMSTGEEQGIAIDGTDPRDNSICPTSHIRDRLTAFAARTGDASLSPAPLLAKLADEGKGFAS